MNSPRVLTLRAPQVPMFEWVRDHPRCALWASMGIGKSSATLFTHEVLRMYGDICANPTLVIGPMRVARDTWPDEVRKWAQFDDVEIVSLNAPPRRRIDLLKNIGRAQFFSISYEMLPWLVEHYLKRWPFHQVVADESDRLKGFRLRAGGERAYAIARVAHTIVKRWVNLTGTPSPNGLKDLWGQTWYLDRGQRLGATFGAFQQRWFRKSWSGYGMEPMPFAEQQIHAALHDICLTVDIKDYYDLHEPLVTRVPVKLPAAARKVYEELEAEMFAEFGEHELKVFNAAALTNKCLQLANGAVYTDKLGSWAEVHDEKIQALESIQAEAGGTPLLVAYQFKSDKARLLKRLRGVVDLSTERGMAAFKGGDAAIGVAHPKSLGHGIDGLQNATNILVRFGHDWNMGERMQMLERIGPARQMQSGHNRVVQVYDIVAEDTMDEDVIAAHAAKRSVQDALLNAMKRRK